MTVPAPQSQGVQPQPSSFSWAFGRLSDQPHVKLIRLQTVLGPIHLFCSAEELKRFARDAAAEAGAGLVVPAVPLPDLRPNGLPPGP